MHSPKGWDIWTGNSQITIAVIDAGCRIDHPDLAANMHVDAGEVTSLTNLGVLLCQLGNLHEACTHFVRSFQILHRHSAGQMAAGREASKFAYAEAHSLLTGYLLSLLVSMKATPGETSEGLSCLLQGKASVFEATSSWMRAIRSSGDSAIASLIQRTRIAQSTYSTLINAGPGQRTVEAYRALLDGYRAEVDSLEDLVAQHNSVFASQRRASRATASDVAAPDFNLRREAQRVYARVAVDSVRSVATAATIARKEEAASLAQLKGAGLGRESLKWEDTVSVSTFDWQPLPQARTEGRMIRDSLVAWGHSGTVLLTDSLATEEAVKAIFRPRILHLSTHGYFLTDQVVERRKESLTTMNLNFVPADTVENPLLRSWLLFAGAR